MSEKSPSQMYELACDWIGCRNDCATEKSNLVLAECLNYDMDKAIQEVRNQTIEEVLKIVDKFYGNRVRDLKEDDFGYALWLVKEKIKNLKEKHE